MRHQNLRVQVWPVNIWQLCVVITVDDLGVCSSLSLFGSRSWRAEIPSHLSKIPSMLIGETRSGRLRCAPASGGKGRREHRGIALQKAEARDESRRAEPSR